MLGAFLWGALAISSLLLGGLLAWIQAFAAGAILVMLANAMIPEAVEHARKGAGLFAVLGLFVPVVMIAPKAGGVAMAGVAMSSIAIGGAAAG